MDQRHARRAITQRLPFALALSFALVATLSPIVQAPNVQAQDARVDSPNGNDSSNGTTGSSAIGTPVPDAPQHAVLNLGAGGTVTGMLVPIGEPNRLAWQSPLFTGPLDFDLAAVTSADFPIRAESAKGLGEFCFELRRGDVVLGSFAALSDSIVEIDSPRFGRLKFAREDLARVLRWDDGSTITYRGPNGVDEWTQDSEYATWVEDRGTLLATKPGASIRADVGLPAQASLEIELSWSGQPWQTRPDFLIEIGTVAEPQRDTSPLSPQAGDEGPRVENVGRIRGVALDGLDGGTARSLDANPFMLEVWDDKLVVQREVDHDADLQVVRDIPEGPGRIRLRIFLDQTKGRILIFGETGNKLADLHVPSRVAVTLPAIRLVNLSGNVQLHRLQVGRWNGTPPSEVEAARTIVQTKSGRHDSGTVRTFDAASREIVFVGADDRESRIAASDLETLEFSPPDTSSSPAPSLGIVYQDGSRLSGDLVRVTDEHLEVRYPGVSEPLLLSWNDLRSLQSLRSVPPLSAVSGSKGRVEAQPTLDSALKGRKGRMVYSGGEMRGMLRDLPPTDGKNCLVWQPIGSRTSSALRPGAACRILFRESPPVRDADSFAFPDLQPAGIAPAPRAVPAARAGVGGFLQRIFSSPTVGEPSRAPMATARLALHLRSGDHLPCAEVSGIDEKGLTFRSDLVSATWIAHDKIQALEMGRGGKDSQLDEFKSARLLTLPRMQRQNPPTHLIMSGDGDYLRGRLVGMDDQNVAMDLRLETRTLPRPRVAMIYWLHPPIDMAAQSAQSAESATAAASETRSRVQVIRSDGTRMTFLATKLVDDVLHGESDVLGNCQVDLLLIDELLVGSAIEDAVAQLAIQRWKLANAPDPSTLVKRDTADGGRIEGTESVLVGKSAPNFELERLDGGPFRLAEQRGKVIVLDFWATWCGPCIRAMPQLDEVVREFADRDVHLVAVNLQETPDKVKSLLERLRISPTVVMDRDGSVAALYDATAIPQTVIIDREGKISRLFVGGGSDFGAQLREAIKQIAE